MVKYGAYIAEFKFLTRTVPFVKIPKLQTYFKVIRAELPREEQTIELLVYTRTQTLISQYIRSSGVQV